MNGTDTYDGTLELGALDAWSFTACVGDKIDLNVRERVANSALTPWIRLLGRDGAELKSISGVASADVSMTAPASGTYTVVISDRTGGFAGAGGYRLTATGLIHQLRICLPSSPAAGFTPTIIGGVPSGTFTLLSSTNLIAPLTEWTILPENQFDEFGTFTITSEFDPLEPKRFFQVRVP
jgi:hypothetical protein